MLCKKCISSSLDYNVTLDEKGVCTHCNFFDRYKDKLTDFTALKKAFDERVDQIKKNRSSSQYDCVIPYSGGKDSTYILHYMHKNYNLRLLAIFCDNHFVNPITMDNGVSILKRLKIDYLLIQPKKDELKEFYASRFKRTGDVCTGCMGFIGANVLKIAAEKRIPAVMIGESRDQMYRGGLYSALNIARPNNLENLFNLGEKGFYWKNFYIPTFNNVLNEINAYSPGNKDIVETVTLKKDPLAETAIPDIIPFFFYHPHDENEMVEALKMNLGWADLSSGKFLSHPGCVYHSFPFPMWDQTQIGHYIKENVITRTDAIKDMLRKISEWLNMDDENKLSEVCQIIGVKLSDIKDTNWYKDRQTLRAALRALQVPEKDTIYDKKITGFEKFVFSFLDKCKKLISKNPKIKSLFKKITPRSLQTMGKRDYVAEYKELLLEYSRIKD